MVKTNEILKALFELILSLGVLVLQTWAVITAYNFFAYEVLNFPLIGWVEGFAFRLVLGIFTRGKSKN